MNDTTQLTRLLKTRLSKLELQAECDKRYIQSNYSDLAIDLLENGESFDDYALNPHIAAALYDLYLLKSRSLNLTEIITAPLSDVILRISDENSKMGPIPSVSLMPVATCSKAAPCKNLCYAVKLLMHAQSYNAWAHNTALYFYDPSLFFSQLTTAFKINSYFRLFVAGDFPSFDFFNRTVEACTQAPSCQVLAFTKQFDIVNYWIRENGKLPDNLIVIFSSWGNFRPDNPFHLPESAVIFKGTEPEPNWKICGGNCSQCASRGVGCWQLKSGEVIAFKQH